MSTCSKCGAPLDATSRYCPSCRADIGAPNVREVQSESEKRTLGLRFEAAKQEAASRKCGAEFAELILFVQEKSCVVVSMPGAVARNLATNCSKLYDNYETLVGAGSRLVTSMQNDRKRFCVAGGMFGSYGGKIVYGFLGFPGAALPSYGRVACRMKLASVCDRVTFLEQNSYPFYEKHKDAISDGEFPKGYRASWDNRHELVLSKLGGMIKPGDGDTEFKCLILTSGAGRSGDEFIEAHIFENFNVYAIDEMFDSGSNGKSTDEDVDVRIAMELFKKAAKV